MAEPLAIFDKPFALMGIVNVTPDSFYDGGRHDTVDSAVDHALKLRDEGADILDIGGASSRPGAKEITAAEEIRRVVPVVEKAAAFFDGPISVDTTWVEVAKAAVDAGASWINDISAGRFDQTMARFASDRKCVMVLMHSRGTPQTMQQFTNYESLVQNVCSELLDSVKNFENAGVEKERIIIDPGIGFAKTAEQNVTLLKEIRTIVDLGFPVLLGTSRKAFIGKITGKSVENRLCGSLATVGSAFFRGVKIFRVHDVSQTRDFLNVLSEIEN
jgi:dihydropteroate synthase